MVEKSEAKPESLLNLDDLLQCPVCYEMPTGQIFQCNEGHHVCGRCKTRLDVCPVCRALFFGTRNYAMEELITNFRKLRDFKLGAKPSNGLGSGSSESSTPAKDTTSGERENNVNNGDEENNPNEMILPRMRAVKACRGLFRCLCCKNGQAERLPAGRLLNHLRYFHAPDLIEGRSENGEYLQAWEFSTVPDKLITAIRVSDMGLFFLTIDISSDFLCAWLTMPSAPWVAHSFVYTITISGNDREAIFSDCVWSVRCCEGLLKKDGHCLIIRDLYARALIAQSTINGKLCIRRLQLEQLADQTEPRAVLRIASRVNADSTNDLEPFPQDLLQNDVTRLSHIIEMEVEALAVREAVARTDNVPAVEAFNTLGREAEALALNEAVARTDNVPAVERNANERSESSEVGSQAVPRSESDASPVRTMSKTARRRMRRRLRAALNGPIEPQPSTSRQANHHLPVQQPVERYNNSLFLTPSDSPASSPSGPSQSSTRNKKRRRYHR